MDLSTSSAPNDTAPADADPELSPLEQEVLDEYARLAGNLDNVLPLPLCTLPDLLPANTPPSALHHPRRPGREALRGDSGRAKGLGAQHDDRVYAVEGERVLDCAAAGDFWG